MFVELVPNIRTVKADDLGIGVQAKAQADRGSTSPDAPEIDSSHPIIQETVRLAGIFGGVIFTGPPGTSKSFFAREAARIICHGDSFRYRFVQFHASYQYEDFMTGFTPTSSGFERKDGPFLELLRLATLDSTKGPWVLVIDELSRADVGRVFGEALTYVERSKRELQFRIANGERVSVPSNLIILATMNPFDRGVDEVDAAFERRFAKIAMDPDPASLEEILTDNGMDEELLGRVIVWFRKINGQSRQNPAAAVGHAYFSEVSDEAGLQDLWNYQLQFLVDRAFRRDPDTGASMRTAWEKMLTPNSTQALDDISANPDPDLSV